MNKNGTAKSSSGNSGTLKERRFSAPNQVIDLLSSGDDDSDIEIIGVKKSPQSAASAARPSIVSSSSSSLIHRRRSNDTARQLNTGKTNISVPSNPSPRNRASLGNSRIGPRERNESTQNKDTQFTNRRRQQQQQPMRRPIPTGRSRKNAEVIDLLDVESSDDDGESSVHEHPSRQEEQFLRQPERQNETKRNKGCTKEILEVDSSPPPPPPPRRECITTKSVLHDMMVGTKRPLATDLEFDSDNDQMATIVAWNRRKQQLHHQRQEQSPLTRVQIRDLRRHMSPSRRHDNDNKTEKKPPASSGLLKRALYDGPGLRISPKGGRSARVMQKMPPSTSPWSEKAKPATTQPGDVSGKKPAKTAPALPIQKDQPPTSQADIFRKIVGTNAVTQKQIQHVGATSPTNEDLLEIKRPSVKERNILAVDGLSSVKARSSTGCSTDDSPAQNKGELLCAEAPFKKRSTTPVEMRQNTQSMATLGAHAATQALSENDKAAVQQPCEFRICAEQEQEKNKYDDMVRNAMPPTTSVKQTKSADAMADKQNRQILAMVETRQESITNQVDNKSAGESKAIVQQSGKSQPRIDDIPHLETLRENRQSVGESNNSSSCDKTGIMKDLVEADILSTRTDSELSTVSAGDESLSGVASSEATLVTSMLIDSQREDETENFESKSRYTFDDDSVEPVPERTAFYGTDFDNNDNVPYWEHDPSFCARRSRWRGQSRKKCVLSPSQIRICEKYDSLFPVAPERDIMKVRVRKLDGENPDYSLITTVDHLTREYTNEKGLPVKEMVVHTGEDDILYKIRIHVQESRFQCGAFLTYIGAYKLKANVSERGTRMLDKRRAHFPQTTEPLQFTDLDGWEKTLWITGENLHGNGNNCYWPHNASPVQPGVDDEPFDHPPGRLSFRGDEEDESDVKFVEEKLRAMKENDLKPVGHLGIYSFEDYEPAPDVPLALHGYMIDLGRYGPFSNNDRKTHSVFDFKSYLFKGQPNRYPIEAKEKLEDELQIIDITSDTTGLPHDVAKSHIPMYVNEVAYSLENKQTVFSTISDCERVVSYNIALHDGLSLSTGSSIELLSNYHTVFEPTRELEGYGIRNIYEGLPGVSESLARRVEQGVQDREDMRNVIDSLSPLKIANAVERISQATHEPILRLIDDCVATGDTRSLSALQIIANRRIEWLGKQCLAGLLEQEKGLERKLAMGEIDTSDVRYLSIKQARESLVGWKTHEYLLKDGKTDTRALGDGKLSMSEVLRREAQEEICFELRNQIVQPFDEAMWCPIAREQIERLCDVVHFGQFPPWSDANEIDQLSRSRLEESLLMTIRKAAESTREAAERRSSCLHFTSGFFQDQVVRGKLSDILAVLKSSDAFYLDCTTIPKAFTAEILRRLALLEELEPDKLVVDNQRLDQPIRHTERLVMVQTTGLSDKNSSLSKIATIPHMVKANEEESRYQVNTDWYLLWQVAFPSIVMINHYIPSFSERAIALICRDLRLEREWIDFALERGIRKKSAESFKCVCAPKKHVIFDQVSVQAHHQSGDVRGDNPEARGATRKKRSRQYRIARPGKKRLHVDQVLGGKRPIGSGSRGGIPNGEMVPLPAFSSSENALVNAVDGTRPKALEIWSGEPDEVHYLDGSRIDSFPVANSWPKGWKKKVYQRASGGTKGGMDRYWFTPVENYKLRSLKEIARFFQCMEACAQDEKIAWKMFKGKTR